MEMILFYFALLFCGAFCEKNVHEMATTGGFSWSSCNTSAVPLAFRSLSVAPDPISFPTELKLSFELEVTQDLGTNGNIQGKLDISIVTAAGPRDVCEYLPDICTPKNVCELVKGFKDRCPDQVKKLGNNCQCPLKKNTYVVKEAVFPIGTPPVYSSGKFLVTITLTEKDKPIGCIKVTFCIDKCSD